MSTRKPGAAFTLIELLIVMIIIAIVISITLPAIGLARRAARKATTQAMLTQIGNAVATFQTDQHRLPGVFTAREMGHADNATSTYGLSAMQNVMFELAGYRDDPAFAAIAPNSTIAADRRIHPDPGSIGLPGLSNNKAYWIPDGKHFVPQNDTTDQQVADTNIAKIPSVIDDFRNPILAWAADDSAVGSITTSVPADARDQFAKITVGPNDAPAKFYWASNACFLTAPGFGRNNINQNSSSALGGTVQDVKRKDSLCGMLGSPNYPNKASAQGPNLAPMYPSTARAPFVLHSAGADGTFVGQYDNGFKPFRGTTGGYIDYRYNFAPVVSAPISPGPPPDNVWTDKNDKPTNRDLMNGFDDLLVSAGN